MVTLPMPGPDSGLQDRFLSILPRLETHGRVYFRHLPCADQKADAVAEMTALCWLWFVSLAVKGKDGTRFPTALASFAARAVQSGRRLVGMEAARDVLSAVAQRRFGFRVQSLSSSTATSHDRRQAAPHGQRQQDAWEERLQENTVTPVPEQAAFRIDFPNWLLTRTERDRGVIADLMLGERTYMVSRKYALSPGRVSQLRREFMEDWQQFCDDPAQA